jgi:hypothetical protein
MTDAKTLASATTPTEACVPRSRRALLGAAAGGLVATMAAALGKPLPARAAAGDNLVLGSQTNNAGTSDTQLIANSSVIAFKLLQQGPGTALMGHATQTSGATRGVYGRSDSPAGFGVQARNAGAGSTGAAMQAIGGNNAGIRAESTTNTGVVATGGYMGVSGYSSSGSGLWGASGNAAGVHGSSANGTGVQGSGNPGVYGSTTSQYGAGVSGLAYGTSGHGVVGGITQDSGTAAGIYGSSAGPTSFAGYFEGKVSVTGSLSKGGGAFRIDHPLDPSNKVLQHSFVESPDMLNIYNGVVVADGSGEATVRLPEWFMALNGNFRYGLTPIGEFAPVFVRSKVSDGRFVIGGAKAGQEVSWQVTGIRRDAWANANRIEVEFDKPAEQRGRYLHPIEHGQPRAMGVDHAMQVHLGAERSAAAAVNDRISAGPPR